MLASRQQQQQACLGASRDARRLLRHHSAAAPRGLPLPAAPCAGSHKLPLAALQPTCTHSIHPAQQQTSCRQQVQQQQQQQPLRAPRGVVAAAAAPQLPGVVARALAQTAAADGSSSSSSGGEAGGSKSELQSLLHSIPYRRLLLWGFVAAVSWQLHEFFGVSALRLCVSVCGVGSCVAWGAQASMLQRRAVGTLLLAAEQPASAGNQRRVRISSSGGGCWLHALAAGC